MKTLRQHIAIILLLLSLRTAAEAYQFSVVLHGWMDTDGSLAIMVSDGREFGTVTVAEWGCTEGPGEPGPEGEPGPPVITDPWTRYLITIPDLWATEGRGITYHAPGHGWTAFFPMVGTDETIDFPGTVRTYPNPNGYTTDVGNRVMLGHWWPTTWSSPASIAKLFTWDNNNPYWPSVGVDFIASTGHTFWRWIHTEPDGTGAQTAMELDYMHRLTLRSRTTENSISLDPDEGAIQVNGQPVVTAGNAVTQLSQALAPAFVRRSAAGVNLGTGNGGFRTQAGLPPQLLLGAANDGRTTDANGTDHTQGVLIVGSVSDPGRNGLRILDDGTVLIRPRGGLQMAPEFQAGQQP